MSRSRAYPDQEHIQIQHSVACPDLSQRARLYTMDSLPRPSSWPIRKERRHIAATNAHLQVLAKLDEVATRLTKLECAYGPPGLIDISFEAQTSSLTKIEAQTKELDDKIDMILHKMDCLPAWSIDQSTMEKRIESMDSERKT